MGLLSLASRSSRVRESSSLVSVIISTLLSRISLTSLTCLVAITLIVTALDSFCLIFLTRMSRLMSGEDSVLPSLALRFLCSGQGEVVGWVLATLFTLMGEGSLEMILCSGEEGGTVLASPGMGGFVAKELIL